MSTKRLHGLSLTSWGEKIYTVFLEILFSKLIVELMMSASKTYPREDTGFGKLEE